MHIDLGVLALIGISALLGYRSGAVRQLSHWIAFAAALLLAKPAAALAAPLLASQTEWPAAEHLAGLRIALFPFVFLAANMIARLVLNLLEPGEERGPLDQALGVGVGLVRGFVVCYGLLVAAVYLQKPLSMLGLDLAGSRTIELARAHDPFAADRPNLKEVERKLGDQLEQRAATIKEGALKTGLSAPLVR